MTRDTRQRKRALAGLRVISGKDSMLGTLVRVNSLDKQALDAVMLEMGRMVAESVVLIKREEVTGPDYYPTDPDLQSWCIKAARFIKAGTCSGTWPSPTAKTPIANSPLPWSRRVTPMPSSSC